MVIGLARKLALSLVILFIFFNAGLAQKRRRNGRSRLNVIDQCWRRNLYWASNRQQLASCCVGFAGKMSNNMGRGVRHYVVTDPSDSDDPLNPRRGTLRYGTSMLRGKVWITFKKDMQISLKQPLLIGSFTTIDGRGADVHIAYGACLLLKGVNNVIIHGLQIHHCRSQPPGKVMGPGRKIVDFGGLDGDAIRLVGSSKIWIDHNTLYQSEDGLLDVTRKSTGVTISNNWFRDHDKVMLLGHDDSFVQDRNMRVTVVFNRFGPNCNQRMPRVRHGYAHVANNLYDGWGAYAIGGSMNPSIKSEANFFIAPQTNKKEVTWRLDDEGSKTQSRWKSVNDVFMNGAFFKQTGSGGAEGPAYNREQRFRVTGARAVRALTRSSGTLRCSTRKRC